MKTLSTLVILVIGSLLVLAACDADEPEPTEAVPGLGTATVEDAADPDPEPDDAPASADSGELCGANESPNGNDYIVADLPTDDPDGGLVAHADAGTDSAEVGVLPSGTPVITTSDPADCLVLADGAVWWHVYPVGDGIDGYVNSRFLTRSPQQEAAGRAELCATYARVIDFEDGPVDGENFAPAAETTALRNLLNGPPPGVSDALDRISRPADSEDLFLAYESLKNYVGPLCP